MNRVLGFGVWGLGFGAIWGRRKQRLLLKRTMQFPKIETLLDFKINTMKQEEV